MQAISPRPLFEEPASNGMGGRLRLDYAHVPLLTAKDNSSYIWEEQRGPVNELVFGPDPPKISFRQSPTGSAEVEFENDRVVYLDSKEADLVWADVYLSLNQKRDRIDLEMYTEELGRTSFIDFIASDIRPLTSTESERRFLDHFVTLCMSSTDDVGDLWNLPALIPQVWVNWIHYDAKDKHRAVRVKQEAFRVDFMLRSNDLGGFVVIEIDGSSHFGGRSFVGQDGKRMFEASMEAYTLHLRKDRWLRKQGWNVIRLSNLEVDEIGKDQNKFKALLADILNADRLNQIRLKMPDWTMRT